MKIIPVLETTTTLGQLQFTQMRVWMQIIFNRGHGVRLLQEMFIILNVVQVITLTLDLKWFTSFAVIDYVYGMSELMNIIY